ncbi:MAG: ABC transporter transmembrane domain-containing protein [Micavibrio sp.]
MSEIAAMTAPKPQKAKSWTLVRRIFRDYLAPHKGRIFLATFFMLLAAGSAAAFAVMIQPVMDDVLTAGDLDSVWILGLGILGIFIVRGFATYQHVILMNRAGQTIVGTIQKEMVGRFIDLDLTFFHKHPSGQLLSRVVNDVNVMRGAVTEGITGIGKNMLTLFFLVGVMFYQDWFLSSIIFIVFPFTAIFVAWVGRRLRKMSGRIQEDMASLSDMLTQVFQGIRLVKAYGMEGHEKERTGKAIDKVRDLTIKSVRVNNLSTPFNEILVGCVVSAIIVYGGYKVASGATTAGSLLSFITAFAMAYEPMKRLAKLNSAFQMGLGAAERVFDMIDRKPVIREIENARDVIYDRPDISFEAVDFTYAGEEENAVSGVSFNMFGGTVTALVGPSGSGKTTIMNMIPRFFDVSAGRILIDRDDIRALSINSLRENIALVSQDITIFDDTVWANIGYGRKGAYQDEIIKAAIAAEADEFIRRLPQGYDTRLGEEGLKLSGGQRQRIAIARAMLRNAPILLLDEATSALDNEAERAIQQTLGELQKGRTTLVIAHRLSTVQNADQILVMDRGRIVERGRHEELLAYGGVYARIYGAGQGLAV